MLKDKRRNYIAYLLRLWQVESKEGTTWRVTLQSPHTEERTGFDSLEELFDFLRERTAETSNMQD